MLVPIQDVRAHHVREMFFDFIWWETFPLREYRSPKARPFLFPIHITDTVDDICVQCRSYPAINLCKGSKMKKMDSVSAEILGVSIGNSYSLVELKQKFDELALGDNWKPPRARLHHNDAMQRFYGEDWRQYT